MKEAQDGSYMITDRELPRTETKERLLLPLLYYKIHRGLAMAKAEYLEELEYPKMPSGFQCFVCGKEFPTNEERIQHLEEESHDSMYDTATPQAEDIRRLN